MNQIKTVALQVDSRRSQTSSRFVQEPHRMREADALLCTYSGRNLLTTILYTLFRGVGRKPASSDYQVPRLRGLSRIRSQQQKQKRRRRKAFVEGGPVVRQPQNAMR
jgi:hypothetical protein